MKQLRALDVADAGQQNLGYLIDILTLVDPDTKVVWDTGENFGMGSITVEEMPAIDSEYSQDSYEVVDSDTGEAYPSCYRGFYDELTFNCSHGYAVSTAANVLELAKAADGRSFGGYKGGVFYMDRGTPVWGGSSSWSSTAGDRQLIGFELNGDILTLKTKEWSY
jgi:rhodanese-related sulfurtransferase